jgi:NCS1 family nucleobase:cation symporter-1
MMALDGTIIPESAEGMSEDQVVWDESEKKSAAFDSRRVSD